MRLVPKHLCEANLPAREAYSGVALQLSPTSAAVSFPERLQCSDAAPRRDGLHVDDFADDLEVHPALFYRAAAQGQRPCLV